MDQEELQNWYEEKYQKKLGISFGSWLEGLPETEERASERMEEIDHELKDTEQQYGEAVGDEKWELGEYRERLRNEYLCLEEMFGLQNEDE